MTEQTHEAAPPSEEVMAVERDTGEPAPAEVERDITAELGKLDQSLGADKARIDYGLPASAPQDPLAFDFGFGLSPAQAHPAAAAPLAMPMAGAPVIARSLDDLYAQFPRIETGEQWIDVERIRPTHYQGQSCKGWIEQLTRKLDMNEFRDRYGGGSYVLRVKGPQLSEVTPDGSFKVRTLGTAEIEIAGAPKFPSSGEEQPMNRQFGGLVGAIDPRVERARIEAEAQERARLDSRADKYVNQLLETRGQGPDWKTLSDLADRRADEVRSSMAESMGALRAQTDKLMRQLEAKEQELTKQRVERDEQIQRLREEVMLAKQQAAEAAQRQETARIAELKEQHDRELRRIKEEQAEKLERLTDDHRRTVEQMSDRNDRDRKERSDAHERERERMREQAQAREKQLIDDHRSREDAMRQIYESRLAESHRSAEREIRSIKDVLVQQMQTVQIAESTKATMAQQTADMQVRLLEGQLSREAAGRDAAEREADALRRSSMKTPLDAIKDARELVDLTGGGKDEGEMDWKKGLVKALSGLTDKMPDIAEKFVAVREQNKQAAVDRQLQIAQQQHQFAQHQQRQMAMPAMARQPPPRRQAHRQAPPGMANPQPPDAAPPLGASMFQPSTTPAPLGASLAPQAMPIQPPHAQPMPVERQPAAAPAAAARPAPPPPPEPAAAPEPAELDLSQLELPPEQIMAFAGELDDAIRGDLIDPEVFAKGFVERAGPDMARAIVTAIAADQLVDLVVKGGGHDSAIVTRKGREYVRQLWEETHKLVGQAA